MSDKSKRFSLTVLGTRGSMAVTGSDKIKYGCGTSCYLVETEDETVIMDAGSGILNLSDTGKEKVSLLITHTHIDHILGLPMFLGDFRGKELWIYGETRGGAPIKQQLEMYMKPPLWPVGFDVFPVDIEFRGISPSFNIGDIKVTTMEANHPGGSTIFGLEYDGRKIVYATDFEHGKRDIKLEADIEGPSVPVSVRSSADSDNSVNGRFSFGYDESDSAGSGNDVPAFRRLAEFAKGADLLLYDAQYTVAEYEKCRGFGHSTYLKALELYELSGAKDMLLVHHAPMHDDAFMDRMATELEKTLASMPAPIRGSIHFAKEGEQIDI